MIIMSYTFSLDVNWPVWLGGTRERERQRGGSRRECALAEHGCGHPLDPTRSRAGAGSPHNGTGRRREQLLKLLLPLALWTCVWAKWGLDRDALHTEPPTTGSKYYRPHTYEQDVQVDILHRQLFGWWLYRDRKSVSLQTLPTALACWGFETCSNK